MQDEAHTKMLQCCAHFSPMRFQALAYFIVVFYKELFNITFDQDVRLCRYYDSGLFWRRAGVLVLLL